MATSFETANWLIDRFEADGRGITQLQLQKLAFIAHGWHLTYTGGQPLVDNEDFVGWKYGPVLESLHKEFKEFGSSHITTPAFLYDWDGECVYPRIDEEEESAFSILEYVYQNYGHMTGPQLINVTHRDGSPWSVVTENGSLIGRVIPDPVIKDYYESLRNE